MSDHALVDWQEIEVGKGVVVADNPSCWYDVVERKAWSLPMLLLLKKIAPLLLPPP
jgi:hypothetical protein